MYPQTLYISKPNGSGTSGRNSERYKFCTVIIRGYQQGISVEGFNRRMMKAGSKAYDTFAGLDAFKYLPNCERDWEIQSQQDMEQKMADKYGYENDDPLYTFYDEEYELVDFYKEIKYDPKSGKIDGRTIRQHIKHYMTLNGDEGRT